MGYKLLIVDSGDLASTVGSRIGPENDDIDITVVRSVTEALEILESSKFDAVLCCSDLGASSMNGIDLLEWLRNSGSRIPFILITREPGKELAIRALNLGADLYLRKDLEETEDVFNELLDYLRSRVESKKQHDRVIESEAQFRNLFETAMDGIIATDLNGNIIQYNESFAKMLGIDIDGAIGERFTKVVPPDLHSTAQQVGLQVQQSGQSDIFEFQLVTIDETRIPVMLSAWRRDNADGIPIGSWVWVRNLSDQRDAETKHLKSEAKFSSIFFESPIAIAIADKNGNIQEINQECIRMFGLNDFESIRNYPMFSDPDLSENVKTALTKGERINFTMNYSFDLVASHKAYPTNRRGVAQIRVFAGPLHLVDKSEIDGYIFQMIEERN